MRTDMQEIDFLPAEFRRQHSKRKHRSWRLVVLAGMLIGVMLAALAQNRVRARLTGELARIGPVHDAAELQSKQLTDLQGRLQIAGARAELYTYLRHPWPRTQILAAVFTPLPDELTFHRVEIVRQRRQAEAPAARRSRNEEKAEEARLAALPPAGRTLHDLRAESDAMETVVTLRGVTSDSAALHRYMGALEKCRLFASAELSGVESAKTDGPSEALQFSALLVVQPGYGIPDGPTGSDQELVAQTASFKKVTGTFAGTARRVLRTKVPVTFLSHVARTSNQR